MRYGVQKYFCLLIFGIYFSANGFTSDFLPKGPCPEVVSYRYFKLCYSPKHRQALWTAHWLTINSITGSAKRKNNYRADYEIINPVNSNDYRGTGFDRGHLVPAADMKLNQKAMDETFFMTNMSPQKPDFNRKIWANLERKLRSMVQEKGNAFVVTAPILSKEDSPYDRIPSGVSIPQRYYKTIYFPRTKEMFGYLLQNRGYENYDLNDFRVPVEILEQITGFDFYSELPDELEESLEAEV